jgi:DNA-binding response OmpR family regulator
MGSPNEAPPTYEDHVLIVDDERFFRESIRDLLMAEGIPFLLAEDGTQAIELAGDPRVGAMILDMQLPDQSGLQVLERVRALRPELRVVVLASHTGQSTVLEALRLGACDYLAKPIHEEETRLSVRRALESYGVARDWASLRARIERLGEEVQRIAAIDLHAAAETVYSEIVAAASRLLGASKSSLLVRDGEPLRVAAAVGHKVPIDELDPVAVGEGVAGQVVAKGEPMLVVDVEADGRFRLPRREHYDSTSFVAVPLAGQGAGAEARGALCVTDPESRRVFAQEDLTLLRLLAFAAHQRLEGPLGEVAALVSFDEETGESSGSEAEVARAICEATIREVEPKALLAGALRAACGELGADLASIFLFDPKSGALCLEAQWEGAGAGDRERMSGSEGLTGSVLASGQPVASAETNADPRFDASIDTNAEGVDAARLILPLRFRGKTLGVARLFGSDPRLASARVAEVLGAALSAAVRNVFLYRSLVDSMNELADARRDGQA